MDAMRCLYASKPCDKVRTFKDNGELHRLCAYHRMRANDAQRRWHSRQRAGPTVKSTNEVSARTKRRRRASQGNGGSTPLPRRQRKMIKHEAEPMAGDVFVPASPPSVDSALTFGWFSNAAQGTCGPYFADHGRLSAEDLALLDELIMGLDETPVMMDHEVVMNPLVSGFLTE